MAAFFGGAFWGAGFFAGVFAGFSLSGEESSSINGALAARGRRVRGGRATFWLLVTFALDVLVVVDFFVGFLVGAMVSD